MKRRVLSALLVLACFGWLAGQVTEKTKHPTAYDKLRETIYNENAYSEIGFNSLRMKNKQKALAFSVAPEEEKVRYQAWLWNRISKIKIVTFAIGGNVDFAGDTGTTFSLNPGFEFESIKIGDITTLLFDFNAGFKRDDRITSLEATAGGILAFEIGGSVTPYVKLGAGPKFPGGADPNSIIWYAGPGISLNIDKKERFKIECDTLFYWATNDIFSDGDLKKAHDTVLDLKLTYSFAGKKIF